MESGEKSYSRNKSEKKDGAYVADVAVKVRDGSTDMRMAPERETLYQIFLG